MDCLIKGPATAKQPEAEPETKQAPTPPEPEADTQRDIETSKVPPRSEADTQQDIETSKVPPQAEAATQRDIETSKVPPPAAAAEPQHVATSAAGVTLEVAAAAADGAAKIPVSLRATASTGNAQGHVKAVAEVTQTTSAGSGTTATAKAELNTQVDDQEKPPDDLEALLTLEVEKQEVLSRAVAAEGRAQMLEEMIAKLLGGDAAALPTAEQVQSMLRRPPTYEIDATAAAASQGRLKRTCTDLVPREEVLKTPTKSAETEKPECADKNTGANKQQEIHEPDCADSKNTGPNKQQETHQPDCAGSKNTGPDKQQETHQPECADSKNTGPDKQQQKDTQAKQEHADTVKTEAEVPEPESIPGAKHAEAPNTGTTKQPESDKPQPQPETSATATGADKHQAANLQNVKTEPSDEPAGLKQVSEEERLQKEAHANYMRYYRSIRKLACVSMFRVRLK